MPSPNNVPAGHRLSRLPNPPAAGSDETASLGFKIAPRLAFVLGTALAMFLPIPVPSSQDFFPIGIYAFDVAHTNDLRLLRDAGFNCVQTYNQDIKTLRILLDACEFMGLKALAYPGTSAGSSFDAQQAETAVAKLDKSPALLAWYLIDEPDYTKVHPADVEKIRITLQCAESHTPSALVLGEGKSAGFYASCADILMVDWYPIPHLPLASFGLAVRQCRLAAGDKKPLWSVVQAFDWAEIFPRAKQLAAGGFPTEQELRAMALLSVIEGANGVFFYAYQANRLNQPITQRPEDWNRLRSTSLMLSRLSPILSSPSVWSPVDLWIAPDQLRWRSATGDEAIQVARKRLSKSTPHFDRGDYLLAVNTTPEKRKSRLRTPDMNGVRVGLAGEEKFLPLVEGWIEDEFEPYATRVYGPLP